MQKLTETEVAKFFDTRTYKFVFLGDGKKGQTVDDCAEFYCNFDHEDYVTLRVMCTGTFDYSRFVCIPKYEAIEALEELAKTGKKWEIHELIPCDQRQKPRLDIDIKSGGKGEMADRVGDAFIAFFKKFYGSPDMVVEYAIYDSSNENKTSRHVIIRNFCWDGAYEGRQFTKKFIETLQESDREAVDAGICADNKSLRIEGSDKKHEGRVKKMVFSNVRGWSFADGLVTCVHSDAEDVSCCGERPVDKAANIECADFTDEQMTEIRAFCTKSGASLGNRTTRGTTEVTCMSTMDCPACKKKHTYKGQPVIGWVKLDGKRIVFICGRPKGGAKNRSYLIAELNPLTIWTPITESDHEFFDFCRAEKINYDLLKSSFALIDNGASEFYVCRTIRDGLVTFDTGSMRGEFKVTKTWHVQTGDADKKGVPKTKEITALDAVKTMYNNIIYATAKFMPNSKGPVGKTFNTFTGFRHARLPRHDPSKIAALCKHIREVFADGDEARYNEILNWFANIAQRPEQRSTAILVLLSEEGAGKSEILNFIGEKVIGKQSYLPVSDTGDLMNRFNSIVKDRLLLVIDEAGGKEQKTDKSASYLKNLATAKEITIEFKFANVKGQTPNYAALCILANGEFLDAIGKITVKDRRFFINRCSDRYVGNREYFGGLFATLTDEAGQHFYTMLMERDLSNYNQYGILKTPEFYKVVLQSVSLPERFMINYVEESETKEITVTLDDLWTNFKDWLINENYKASVLRSTFIKWPAKFLGAGEGRKKTYYAKREDAVKYVKDIYNYEIEPLAWF